MSDTPKRPEEMSAWERWEMASFDTPRPKQPPTTPTPAKSAPEPTLQIDPSVKLPTAEEVDNIYNQARDEGHRVGFNEGQQTALAEAQKLGALAQKLDAALGEMDGSVAEELLALSLEVARQVVRESVRLRPESILAVVQEALLQLPHQHATIYLNPEDAALLRGHLGEQLGQAGHRIQDDPALARGDCLIDAGNTRVDATLANRWQRIVATLGGTLELNAAEGP